MAKYTLEDLRFHEEINRHSSTVPYDQRNERMMDRFGVEDIRMDELLDGLDKKKYTYIEAGDFDSPGYDMFSYVVAWLEDGEIKQECFIEELY